MKDMNMKEMTEHRYHKMRAKRNFLLRAFVVNYAAIFVAWLVSMAPGFNGLLVWFMHGTAADAHMYMMDMLGFWKILGVVLFLVPALAAWWEMHSLSKREM